MTTRTTEETVRAAFARWREQELARATTSPGMAAVRRTVRRRRIATRATAGLTAVLLLGSAYLTAASAWIQPDPISPIDAGAPAQPTQDQYSGWFDLDPAEVPLSGLASAATGGTSGGAGYVTVFDYTADQLIYDDMPVPTLPPSLDPPPATTPYPVFGLSNYPWEYGEHGLQPGGYSLRVACAGPVGDLDLTIRIGVHQATITVECGPSAEDAYAGRAVTDLGELTEAALLDGFGITVWRGELPEPQQPLALALALVTK